MNVFNCIDIDTSVISSLSLLLFHGSDVNKFLLAIARFVELLYIF